MGSTSKKLNRKTLEIILVLLLLASAWLYGLAVGHYKIFPANQLVSAKNQLAKLAASLRIVSGDWGRDFRIVEINSTADLSVQKAYFRSSLGQNRPLIVSLHSWIGDYAQPDSLVPYIVQEDWNYIHPDFRGPNGSFKSCLSEYALQDIDDAISYALRIGNVDPEKIFVVGGSGGGYATLGNYLRSRHHIKAHISWAPISDLKSWFLQSRQMKQGYADSILKCTSLDGAVDFKEMENRSPLFWKVENLEILEIFAGIDDGYTGSVPISHSILFFNKLAEAQKDYKNRVGESDIAKLLSREVAPLNMQIEGRDILYRKNTGNVSLTVFQGGHEMLVGHTVKRIKELSHD